MASYDVIRNKKKISSCKATLGLSNECIDLPPRN